MNPTLRHLLGFFTSLDSAVCFFVYKSILRGVVVVVIVVVVVAVVVAVVVVSC